MFINLTVALCKNLPQQVPKMHLGASTYFTTLMFDLYLSTFPVLILALLPNCICFFKYEALVICLTNQVSGTEKPGLKLALSL